MYFNLDSKSLLDISVERKEGSMHNTGALCTTTGEYTGRAPDAKAYVRDSTTEDLIDWSTNRSITEEEFALELESFLGYKNRVNPIFCQTVSAVRDPRYSLDVVVYTEKAKHSLFVRNMFVPDSGVYLTSPSAFHVYHFPNKERTAKVLISLKERVILITGSDYSGEIKKSIFSVLSFQFPQQNSLPMHCSVNVDKDRKNAAIFFGLSGTGKTTLSSDENRILIGDDEHGWTKEGLTNFEAGCYAKTINLSEDSEPQIWGACHKPGTILENVIYDTAGALNFNDNSLTENTRASYPCSSIAGADKDGYVNCHPRNVIMLTCDAFGVLPAVMKLSPDEAVKQFLLGYTAKVAGTEAGVKEPQATFSACFGAPFMPLPPKVYAGLLKEKVAEHNTQCWLVNTGWAGGQYGVGSRMPISVTRNIIDLILNNSLSSCPTEMHYPTGFTVPKHPSIDEKFTTPENSWEDKDKYEQKASELMHLFLDQAKKL
jgi:phosphoenolpyruvate carboxykinase (ATP)|tara:strand:- start:5937 stop:7394 length:1458 start_codon:yes stop_codon:yes gene_type:complete